VALSNDYDVILRGLNAMLADHRDEIEIVDVTADVDVAPEADVILYDTFGRLPHEDKKLRTLVETTDAKVVLFSWETYPPDAGKAHGAVGYVHKGASVDELIEVITAAHEGRSLESTEHPEETADSAGWPGQDLGLSQREAEILAFIVLGLTNQEIADGAFLSVNTVKTYVRTAYRKIGATNRAQAVVWAMSHGLGRR
jgi:DNA-binding NarL/FixJ family response regulator